MVTVSRRGLGSLVVALVACGNAPVPPALPPPSPLAPAPALAEPAPLPTDPSLSVLFRPSATPAALVHVEIDVVAPGASLTTWRLGAGTPDHLAHVAAHDAKSAIAVQLSPAGGAGAGVDLALDRAASGSLHLEYDVLARSDAPDDPLATVVADGHFRGAGEQLIALAPSIDDAVFPITLTIDGAQAHAVKVASSLGVGATRQAKLHPRSLRYAEILGGPLGDAAFDAPEGHDEAAWLGSPGFDPRAAFAELAQLRTDLAEMLRALDTLPGPRETYLIDASVQPALPFVVTPRFESVLLQVGPHQPWDTGLRMTLTQLLARRWIGDAIRLAAPADRAPELAWFTDGVSRYLAMRLLGRAGFLGPDAWAATIAGELSSLATSPYASAGSARLAALADKDPQARVAMMARGALYATRESAAITAHTKGTFSLEHPLGELLKQARAQPGGAPLPLSAWQAAVGKDDPDAAKTFDAIVVHGGAISLPDGALGPCFRAGVGDFVTFDPGFDLPATRAAADKKIVGLRAGGPAAKAGVKEGDAVESLVVRDGDASEPVVIELDRDGKTVDLQYKPAGPHVKAQTWTRNRNVPDEKCGAPP